MTMSAQGALDVIAGGHAVFALHKVVDMSRFRRDGDGTVQTSKSVALNRQDCLSAPNREVGAGLCETPLPAACAVAPGPKGKGAGLDGPSG